MTVSGCQTSFKVEPSLTQLDGVQTLATNNQVKVLGADKFDKKVFPVTFSCSGVDFNLAYSEQAKQSILLAAQKLPAHQNVQITVSEVMVRVMNLLNQQYEHRFDVEVRIGLIAEFLNNTGENKKVSVSEQTLSLGPSSQSFNCAPAKEALELALPKALNKTLTKLVSDATNAT